MREVLDPAAHLFDLDGTLVDTMSLHFEAYRRALATVGIELQRGTFDALIGGVAAEVIPALIGEAPCSVEPGEIHRRKLSLMKELVASEPLPRLPTAAVFESVRRHSRTALVSSGSRPSVQLVLDALGWTDSFDAVVTGDDVTRGKPDPECYALAARLLAVECVRCVAYEDTDAGVAAAAAAGMYVIDVRGTEPDTAAQP